MVPQSTLSRVLHGYAFDGLLFHRACVDRKTKQVINKITHLPLGVDPIFLRWYTQREFTAAIARLQGAKKFPADATLVSVAPTKELMDDLRKSGKLMDTENHILRMLTNGVERARGSAFTDAEKAEYKRQASALYKELLEATGSQAAAKTA